MQDELDLQSLLGNLSSPNESDRIFAAEDLGVLADEEAIEPLLAQFSEDESIAAREAIARALFQFNTPLIVEKVAEWLYSNVAATRNHAVRFLQSKGELNCDFLDSLYHSEPDPDIRKFIVDSAVKFSTDNCRRFLSYGMKDEDINVRIAAVEYAGQRQITELQDDIINLLIATTEPMLMSSVLEGLSNFNDAKTFDAIKVRFATLNEEELYYAPWIARFYGGHGRAEDLSYLLDLLNSCPGQIDGVLAEGISMMLIRIPEIQIPETLYPWFEALFDQSEDDNAINHTLRLLLSRKDDQAAQHLLISALNSYNKRTRLHSINAITSNHNASIYSQTLAKRLAAETNAEVKEALTNAIG